MMDDPFGYLTFGGTFRRAMTLLFDRFDLYMAIAAVAIVPFVIIFFSALVVLFRLFFWGYPMEDNVGGPVTFLVFGIESFVYALATVIGQGAITMAVAKVYIGEQPEWLSCLKVAWKRKWSLFCACIMVEGTIFLGMMLLAVLVFVMDSFTNGGTITLLVVSAIAFSVGSAYAYSGLLLVSPSIMVEGFASPIKGMKRSWELSTGSRCYLVCTMMSLGFCILLLNAFLVNLFGGGYGYYMISPVEVVIRIVPMAFYFPLHSILETVLYLNLRIGRESMNHEVLSADLMNSTSPTSRLANSSPAAISDDSLDYRHVPLMDDADDGVAMAPPNATSPV